MDSFGFDQMHTRKLFRHFPVLYLSNLVISLMQELKFDPENDVHFLDALPKSVDLGTYHFVFEVIVFDIVLS